MLKVQGHVESESPSNSAFLPKIWNPVQPPSAHSYVSGHPQISFCTPSPSPPSRTHTLASSFRYARPNVEFKHTLIIICCIYLINFTRLVIFFKMDDFITFYFPLSLLLPPDISCYEMPFAPMGRLIIGCSLWVCLSACPLSALGTAGPGVKGPGNCRYRQGRFGRVMVGTRMVIN